MKNSLMYVLAMIVSLAVAGTGSQALAQTKKQSAREAAIHKCVLEAVTQYPRTPDSNDSARTALYVSCMGKAGFRP